MANRMIMFCHPRLGKVRVRMLNRPFNTVLARLGLVAAILATLMLLAPVALAADAEYNVPGERGRIRSRRSVFRTLTLTRPTPNGSLERSRTRNSSRFPTKVCSRSRTRPTLRPPTTRTKTMSRRRPGGRRQRLHGDRGGQRRHVGRCCDRDERGRAWERDLHPAPAAGRGR